MSGEGMLASPVHRYAPTNRASGNDGRRKHPLPSTSSSPAPTICLIVPFLLLPLHHTYCCLVIVPELPLRVNLIQRTIRLEDGKALVDLWQQHGRPCSALVEADIVVIFVKSATEQ